MKEQLATRVEEKDAERAMQGIACKNVGHKVAMLFRSVADYFIFFVYKNTFIFVKETQLLLIILLA